MTLEEFAALAPSGSTIILDIDGTLVPAGGNEPSDTVLSAASQLAQNNDVYLFSNSTRLERNRRIAERLGLPFIETTYRKPHPKVIHGLPPRSSALVVVGDKVLTDGLFAFFTGAQFIRISRVTSREESALDQALNAIDDVAEQVWQHARLMRAGQWTKNLLVFAPLFFARQLLNVHALGATLATFAAFCFLASAGYIINDLYDASADRLHPRKRYRPLASREVSASSALLFSFLLASVAAWLLAAYAPAAFLISVAYAASSVVYSIWLKRVAIIEMLLFIWFYFARIFAGAVAAAVPLSSWLILTVLFLAFFLVIAKRYAQRAQGSSRALGEYPKPFLEGMLFLSATLVVCFYALYTILGISDSSLAALSVVPVLGGVARYLQLVFKNNGVEYPEKLLFADRGLLFAGVAWLAVMVAVFY